MIDQPTYLIETTTQVQNFSIIDQIHLLNIFLFFFLFFLYSFQN
jgi:hypothetical protein